MKDFYIGNIKATEAEIKKIQKSINSNSIWRLLTIGIGGFLIFKSFSLESIGLVLSIILVSIIVFLFLVARQSKLEKIKAKKQDFLTINKNEFKNLENKFENIYENGKTFENPDHPYTSDLDVFGEFSLFAFINRCATKGGNKILASWLSEKQARNLILERQQAVKELADNTEWSQDFQTFLFPNLGEKKDIRLFLAGYFKAGKQKIASDILKTYVRLAPWMMGVIAVGSLIYTPLAGMFLTLCIFHLGITSVSANKISRFSNNIDKAGKLLKSYSQVLEKMENAHFQSDLLVRLKSKLRREEDLPKISEALAKLGVLVNRLDTRNNLIVGSVLNMLLLWDYKCVLSIKQWIEVSESIVFDGIEVVSEMEALLSLSTLNRNYPQWITPELYPDFKDNHLDVEDVHHPLLDLQKSVGNDFSMAGFDVGLITGSNMAGKSTFLRTIGINAILAYSGAVVNAKSFKTPIFQIVTYMRIKDSLHESTSTFKAELDRMKFILKQVQYEENSFFLIDEMFRGTNSVDKYLGSEAVIKKLLSFEGNGLVATHDLKLSSLEAETQGKVRNYHFDIQVQGNDMHFDYKLKKGECTVFNASMLLENIGVTINK